MRGRQQLADGGKAFSAEIEWLVAATDCAGPVVLAGTQRGVPVYSSVGAREELRIDVRRLGARVRGTHPPLEVHPRAGKLDGRDKQRAVAAGSRSVLGSETPRVPSGIRCRISNSIRGTGQSVRPRLAPQSVSRMTRTTRKKNASCQPYPTNHHSG